MEILDLRADRLLNSCGRSLNNLNSEEKERIVGFAYSAAREMLGRYGTAYSKLRLSVFDGIFLGKRSVSELTREKYPGCTGKQLERLGSCVFLDLICRGETPLLFPFSDKGGFKVLDPIRIGAELKGDIGEIEEIAKKIKKASSGKRFSPFSGFKERAALKRKGELQLKIASGIMRIKSNEAAFIKKFNEEKFLRGIDLGRVSERVSEFCGTEMLIHLAELYAMAFCGMSFKDLYTVDEVFGIGERDIRSKEVVRGEAAADLVDHIDRLSDEGAAAMLIDMGKVLPNVSLPQCEPDNAAITADCYPDYCSVFGLGGAYLRACEGNPKVWFFLERDYKKEYEVIIGRAKLLQKYGVMKKLCEEIPAICESGGKSISVAAAYPSAKKLQVEVKGFER